MDFLKSINNIWIISKSCLTILKFFFCVKKKCDSFKNYKKTLFANDNRIKITDMLKGIREFVRHFFHSQTYFCLCFRCLQATDGFKFTPRTREDLPSGFPSEIEDVCYFLDGYEHPDFAGCDDTELDHIGIALQELTTSKEVT